MGSSFSQWDKWTFAGAWGGASKKAFSLLVKGIGRVVFTLLCLASYLEGEHDGWSLGSHFITVRERSRELQRHCLDIIELINGFLQSFVYVSQIFYCQQKKASPTPFPLVESILEVKALRLSDRRKGLCGWWELRKCWLFLQSTNPWI